MLFMEQLLGLPMDLFNALIEKHTSRYRVFLKRGFTVFPDDWLPVRSMLYTGKRSLCAPELPAAAQDFETRRGQELPDPQRIHRLAAGPVTQMGRAQCKTKP